jgi:hypothetical protein
MRKDEQSPLEPRKRKRDEDMKMEDVVARMKDHAQTRRADKYDAGLGMGEEWFRDGALPEELRALERIATKVKRGEQPTQADVWIVNDLYILVTQTYEKPALDDLVAFWAAALGKKWEQLGGTRLKPGALPRPLWGCGGKSRTSSELPGASRRAAPGKGAGAAFLAPPCSFQSRANHVAHSSEGEEPHDEDVRREIEDIARAGCPEPA